MEAQGRTDPLPPPPPPPPPAWQLRHAGALVAGADTYDDPATGYSVMTSAALARRDCCGNGCRHCPYEWQNVRKEKTRGAGGGGGGGGDGTRLPAPLTVDAARALLAEQQQQRQKHQGLE